MKEIPLRNRAKEVVGIALVSDDDYEEVSKKSWCVVTPYPGYRYAYSSMKKGGKKTLIAMHRFIMQPSNGNVVDHINGDGLDNRRENLRVCSLAQNSWNQKKMADKKHGVSKGVTLERSQTKPWRARIQINGKRYSLGIYATEEEAARVYEEASRKYHKEFSRLI